MKFWLVFVLAGMALLIGSAGAFTSGPYCAGVPSASSAISQLRTINTAEVTYAASERRYGTMQELVTAGLLDSRFLTTVSDFDFNVTVAGADYRATAEPHTSKIVTDYYSGADAVIRYGPRASPDLRNSPAS